MLRIASLFLVVLLCSGCAFHTRCPAVMDKCRSEAPPLRDAGRDHSFTCHLED